MANERRSPLAAAILAVGPAVGLAACLDAPDPESASVPTGPIELAVHELERLAFVGAGRTSIDSPIDVGSDIDLLVDRFELTVREWRRLFPAGDPIPDAFRSTTLANDSLYPREWALDVPVVGASLEDARVAADRRGMRIPTFEEWMWCALGPRSRRFPAGRNQRGLANVVELGLGRVSPVGAFESGQTLDTGIYDLLGNVWEWVEPPLPTEGGWRTLDGELAWPVSGGRDAPTWVMGGSYATPARPMYAPDGTLYAEASSFGARSSSIGFRCVANAEEYLRRLTVRVAPEDLDPDLRRRVIAVGERWGGHAAVSLRKLAGQLGGMTVVHLLAEGASR